MVLELGKLPLHMDFKVIKVLILLLTLQVEGLHLGLELLFQLIHLIGVLF